MNHLKLIPLTFFTTLSLALISTPITLPAQSKPKLTPQPIPLSLATTPTRPSFRPKDRTQTNRPYSPSDRVIIGSDDRIPVLTRAYPWSAIGRIAATTADGSSYTCTGTLIGIDIVLTNAHCLIDATTNQPIIERNQPASNPAQITFQPSLIKGIALDSARVINYRYGSNKPRTFLGDDWAILKLDQPLGLMYGYMSWQNLDFTNPTVRKAAQNQITLVGYAGDFPTSRLSRQGFGNSGETAGMNEGCSIEGMENKGNFRGVLLHRCDSNPGASGGPLFAQFSDGNYYIIGLHSGSSELRETSQLSNGDISSVINRGVAVSRWANEALIMR